jgi:L-iditol 2-dehydrogenase
MKALVKTAHGADNMEIMDVPMPQILPDEVLVKVSCVGVCGTDLKIQDGRFGTNVPVIVGHEFAGEIASVGASVINLAPGMRVVSEQHWKACGVCEYCLTGRRHLCLSKRSPGYLSDGAYAEFIAVNQSLIHRVPDGMSDEQACLLEPMGIAAHAIFERCAVKTADQAVILGCGPIALIALQILKAMGVGSVTLTGLDADTAERFPLAKRLGADRLINVEREDAKSVILAQTKGVGADLVIDLSGAPRAIKGAFEFLKRDGRFCAIGLPHGDVCLPWAELVMKAAQVSFSFSSSYATWEKCLWLVASGRVDLSPFTAAVYPLEDWRRAFEDARSGRVLKAIIRL